MVGGTHNEIDAEFISVAVQARDIGSVTLQVPGRVPEALAGLPPGSPSFTGRARDLEDLLACLAPTGTAGTVVVAAALGGMGGIGKTELAIQAARTGQERGWFPGGVLFVDMRGYDPDPALRLGPGHALEAFLRALGIPGEHIPSDDQDRARLLRSLLAVHAQRKQRVLIVVDNVSTSEQARPLLPSDGACTAIVTSRHVLADLDARLVNLDVLPIQQALDLLDTALRLRDPADARIHNHPKDARRLAKLCAGLPLALQIVAALMAANPAKPLAAMTADLDDATSRLEEISFADRAVRAVFDASYRLLPEGQAQLFRLLSLNPGPDISTPAAAALVGQPDIEARRGLELLARAHLIEPDADYGRWRMHDLLRLHSTHHGQATAHSDQRGQALTRLLDFYLTTTRAAVAHLHPRMADPASLGFPTREQALAWLNAEYPNLIAATHATAADSDHLDFAGKLPNAMFYFFRRRWLISDWVTLTRIAVNAARALREQSNLKNSLISLGVALKKARRFDEAVIVLEESVQIARGLGSPRSEAVSLSNLGSALHEMGCFDEAISKSQAALEIYRDLGEGHGEATALNIIGEALQELGRIDEAIATCQKTVRFYRATGDHYREAEALNTLGTALRKARRFDEASTAHQTAARRFSDRDDHHDEATALYNLGINLREAGILPSAITAFQRAAKLFRDTGDRRHEAIARTSLQEAKQKALAALRETVQAPDAAQPASPPD